MFTVLVVLRRENQQCVPSAVNTPGDGSKDQEYVPGAGFEAEHPPLRKSGLSRIPQAVSGKHSKLSSAGCDPGRCTGLGKVYVLVSAVGERASSESFKYVTSVFVEHFFHPVWILDTSCRECSVAST